VEVNGPGGVDVEGGAHRSLPDLTCAERTDAPVLITGDRDADLQMVAKAIHRGSRRAGGPLMMLDCVEASEAIIESRLFGLAELDAASGPAASFLEHANRGTLFIGRVDAMSAKLQTRLFEFLDECKVRRAGAERAHARVDVRLISSARSAFAQRVGVSFRQDLFYRLNTIHIVVPPDDSGTLNSDATHCPAPRDR
jgi:DNA-binding NtrC family response regulator